MKSNISKAYSKRRNEIVEDRIKIELEKIEKEKLRPYEKRCKKSAAIITFETYDDRFKVPLCFCGHGVSSHNIIPEQVRSIDIFPTIFDILNLKDLSNRGRSLSPCFFGKKLDITSVLIESTSNTTKSITSNSIGVRTLHYKYFRDRDNATKNIHLYDLEIDPLEEKNIANEFPKIVEKMENLLNEEKSQKSFAYKKSDDLNEDEVQMIEEELKKLGYIN